MRLSTLFIDLCYITRINFSYLTNVNLAYPTKVNPAYLTIYKPQNPSGAKAETNLFSRERHFNFALIYFNN